VDHWEQRRVVGFLSPRKLDSCYSDIRGQTSPALSLVVYHLQESQHGRANLQKKVLKEEGLCSPRPYTRYKGIIIERLSLSTMCQGFIWAGFHGVLQDVIQNIIIEEAAHSRLEV